MQVNLAVTNAKTSRCRSAPRTQPAPSVCPNTHSATAWLSTRHWRCKMELPSPADAVATDRVRSFSFSILVQHKYDTPFQARSARTRTHTYTHACSTRELFPTPTRTNGSAFCYGTLLPDTRATHAKTYADTHITVQKFCNSSCIFHDTSLFSTLQKCT